MNVVHKWECSLPSNYKKWTIKMFFYIRYFITNNHFANDEILRIKKLLNHALLK